MSIREQVTRLAEQERAMLRERFGVRRLGLFGSCLLGRMRPDSDVDVLVEFDELTFDNYMGLLFFLEGRVGRKVDLVIAESLKPRLRPHIMREVEYV
ncbi:nucleotidyltransferase family protein [bacterium]|nr:nucleotidyltransferase family protein [bacterium]